ncbi:MAG: hypothetical protein AABX01_06535 [Candidatus Micrarchaeota archaeon]
MGIGESLSEFYSKIEEGYYTLLDKLKDAGFPIYDLFVTPLESKGIPSLPVLVLLMLLIVGGIAFFAFSSQPVSLKLSVESDDGTAIDGASVILTSGDFRKEALTSDGVAEFTNLPKNKAATITVEKEGYAPVSRDIILGQLTSVKIIMEADAGVLIELLVVDFQGLALEGVAIDYTYADKSGEEITQSAVTDALGKAAINMPEKTQVTANALLSGYEPNSITFTPEKGQTKRIVLKKIEATPEPPPSSDKSQLEIQVKDDSDESAIEANLEIYDQDTQELLKEARTTRGIYKTSEFSVGAKIKVVSKSVGYEDAIKVKTLLPKTILPIRMVRQIIFTPPRPPTNDSVISVYNEKGSPLSSEIRMWEYLEEANYTLLKKLTGSELRMPLNPERLHYATAWKEGYLPAKSPLFIGSASINLTLIKGSANNSANISVIVIDEDAKKISGATIAFFDELGDQVAPFDLKTDFAGKVRVKYFPFGVYRFLASKSPQTGFVMANTAETTEITITLGSQHGTLEISATDWSGNETVAEFQASIAVSGDKNSTYSASCTAFSGSCSVDVRAGRDLVVAISAPGYEAASQVVKPIPNAAKIVKFKLMELGASTQSKIALDRVVDLNYNGTENLVAGSLYVALIDVYAGNSTDYSGVFVRLEDEAGNEIAHIVNYSWEGEIPDSVIGSMQIKKANPCVTSFEYPPQRMQPLSWLDAKYSFGGSAKVAYLFKVDSGLPASSLKIKYRSYSVIGRNFFRDPLDAILGEKEETGQKEWCEAQAKSASFAIEVCGGISQSCCASRDPSNGGLCNDNLQCKKGDGIATGICSLPTACGSSSYFCTDNNVCCERNGNKACIDSSKCSDENNRECNPGCESTSELCNSAGPVNEAGKCGDEDSLCGSEGAICCISGDKCEANLKCSPLQNRCIACGGRYQACCIFPPTDPKIACRDDLQCNYGVCSPPQLCGASKEKCVGGEVCCNVGDNKGACTAADDCKAPVKCPVCPSNFFCDSTNLDKPSCVDCKTNPSACGFCSLNDSSTACKNGICLLAPGKDYGLCTSCGNQSQPCCANNACSSPTLLCSNSTNKCEICGTVSSQCCPGSVCGGNLTCSSTNVCEACGMKGQTCCGNGAQCVQANTVCSSEDGNVCAFGNKDCNSESCLSFDFEQVQCDLSTKSCGKVTGTNGFVAHSLKNCGSNCSIGNLVVSYDVENLADTYPGELTIEISDIKSLEPISLFSGGNKITQLDHGNSRIRIPIPDSLWLKGKINFRPLAKNPRVILSFTFDNGNSEIVLRPFVSVINLQAPIPPKNLPNLFACEKLELKAVIYPGTTTPVIESSCDKIIFQVDPIFPADAIPFDDSGMSICGTYDLLFGTAANSSIYNNCFDYSASPGGKALRYWPSKNSACPISPVGNMVQAPNVTMGVRCLASEGATRGLEKKIQIIISNYSLLDIPALDISTINYKSSLLPLQALPPSFYLFNDEQYSPLRLVYALNNRVRTSDDNAFNRKDNFWLAEYSGTGSLFTRAATASQLIRKSEIASLISWDSSKKASPKIYFDDSSGSLAKMPSQVAAISQKEPLPKSLASKLVTKTLGRINPELNSLKNAFDSCKTSCESDVGTCKSDCPSGDDGFASVAKSLACGLACDAKKNPCLMQCSSNYANGVDLAFSKGIVSEFKSISTDVASKTAFRRSFEKSIFCTKAEPNEADTQNRAICRGSAADWLGIKKNIETDSQACTFCKEVYASSYGAPASDNDDVDSCDIRCQPDESAECSALGSTGYCASITAGESYINSTGANNICADGDDDPATDDGYGCLYSCNAKSPKLGDYCGMPSECSACSPDGKKFTESIVSYDYVWENTSRLFEVVIPSGVEAQDAMVPYKYFVSSPKAQPFTFSAVLPLTANMVYNQLNKAPYFNQIDNNLISIGDMPDACKVRQGIYLLQTKTHNGIAFYSESSDSSEIASLSPLSLSDNYPESQKRGEQDYCGNVPACNLFDPYDVESWKPSMKSYFNKTTYPSRCFTYEWPIIPDSMKLANEDDKIWMGLMPYGGTRTDFNRYITESVSVFSARLILTIAFGLAGGVLGGIYLSGVAAFSSGLSVYTISTLGAIILGSAAGSLVGRGTSELVLSPHPKKWIYVQPEFYSFPVSQQLPTDLESAYLLGQLIYTGGKACFGCNDVPWTVHAYAVSPYDIYKYPNVFGTEWQYAHKKTSLDPDDIDTVTIDDFGDQNLQFHICGKDIGETDCYS